MTVFRSHSLSSRSPYSRTVLPGAPLGIALMLDFAWYLQGDYLYTVLTVAFELSVLSATRRAYLYASQIRWEMVGAVGVDATEVGGDEAVRDDCGIIR